MQGLHGSAELERDLQRRGDLERRSARHHLAEPMPFDELRDGERPARVELTELQYASDRRMRRRRRNDRAAHSKDRLRGLGRRGEIAREEADGDTMAGRFVFAQAHGAERSGADLADDAIATAHAQPARESLTELVARTRRRARLSFTTAHTENLPVRLKAIHNHSRSQASRGPRVPGRPAERVG